ncbi:large conductance mechanosensitive channel protein MscL [bacterium c-19]|nr:large conductance mechanosensitive channel protein MscL [bacterium c-19]
MKKIIEEFKVFIMRGNVLDLAIGVIIGGAFQKIVNSLVNDVIMPLISLITGGINFSNWFLALDNSSYAVLAEAQANGANTLNYGLFLTEVLNFLIMAFVIFMFVKTMNRIASKRKKVDVKEEAVKTKQCPYCKTEIDAQATRCPHCTSVLE